jgi:hypothetical protein
MADEIITTYLYIDTSVFEYRHFDFKGKAFAALLELAKAGRAQLLTSEITMRECKAHIHAQVLTSATARKKLAAEAWILSHFQEYAILFEKPDKDDLTERAVSELDDYMTAMKADEIDLDEATITDIVEQYFSELPPFGSGAKKAEFPDAIVLSALIAWCEENDESCYVITRDKNMQVACEEADGLHPLLDIADFLNLANSHEKIVANKLKAILKLREET